MYHFIVNSHSQSKRGKNLWTQMETVLRERNTKYTAHITEYPGHAKEIAKTLCKEAQTNHPDEPLTLITVGGDGTVNEVLNGITDFDKLILGFIPTGSGNDCVKNLGLPSNPMAALERVLRPNRVADIDLGELHTLCDSNLYPNEDDIIKLRRFGVSSGIGYDADICEEVAVSKLKSTLNKIHMGKAVYFLVAIKQIFTHKPVTAKVILDNNISKTGEFLCIVAMNGAREGGGLRLAPKAKMNDKKLSVCIVKNFKKWQICLLLPTLLLGIHPIFKGIDVIDCQSLEVICQEPTTIHTDGECAGKHSHVKYELRKKQVKVLM